MSEQLDSTEQHGHGVGNILEGKVKSYVPSSLFKEDILPPNVLPRADAGSSHKPRPYVADYVAIEIWHHHHVKLVRFGYQLGRREGRRGREVGRERRRKDGVPERGMGGRGREGGERERMWLGRKGAVGTDENGRQGEGRIENTSKEVLEEPLGGRKKVEEEHPHTSCQWLPACNSYL